VAHTHALCRPFAALALIVASSAIPAAAKDQKPKPDHALQHAVDQSATGSLDVIIRVVPGGHDVVRAKLVIGAPQKWAISCKKYFSW